MWAVGEKVLEKARDVNSELHKCFEWDDSIITDVDEELNKRVILMQYGLASKLETRMWYFGETERQATEALTRVDEERIEQMKQDTMMQENVQNNQFGNYSNTHSFEKNYAGRRDHMNDDDEE